MPISEILVETAKESSQEATKTVKESSLDSKSFGNEFSQSNFSLEKSTEQLSEQDAIAFEEALQSLKDVTLPNTMVENAVHRACEFFNIPEVPVVEADGTCVWTNDATSMNDDLFGFNREQLMEMGVSGEDSLILVYTHECAHRCLQNRFLDAWTEELACDYFAGIHAGLDNINLDNFQASLGCTDGGSSHPTGALRAQFIEAGKQATIEMQLKGIEVTFDNCLNNLNKYFEDKKGLITEYREHIEDKIFTEQLSSFGEISFKGFVDDKAWNMKQAEYNFEQAKYHEKEAVKATERGDHTAAKDHLRKAQSYNSKGNEYLKDAKNSKK